MINDRKHNQSGLSYLASGEGTGGKGSVLVIGGGAAGFFCAINAARLNPQLKVTILEKTSKLLSKVKVSGGGRCNVTHAIFGNPEAFISRTESSSSADHLKRRPADMAPRIHDGGLNRIQRRAITQRGESNTLLLSHRSDPTIELDIALRRRILQ